MRNSESHKFEPREIGTTEERLLKEIEELRRQLTEKNLETNEPPPVGLPKSVWRPSGATIVGLVLVLLVLLAIGFFTGYMPLKTRQAELARDVQQEETAAPRVDVSVITRSSLQSSLELPGNIEALTEAPILARADGYIKRRLVDIGDRVKAGQPLAEIEAPELDQQVIQANAALQQVSAALEQAKANYEQGKSNLDLAKVTAQRWATLVEQGVVSRQDNDQYQAQYKSQTANVQALEKAIAAATSNVASAQANLDRLQQLQSYKIVKAPFDGVVTLRNIDVGVLVNSANTLLFRIAQTGVLRTYLNVPETNANYVHVGQGASLRVDNLPNRVFVGKVVRTANALDPSSRTLLTEVEVPNPDRQLLPGMYARVDLSNVRAGALPIIPADSLIVRADGTQVALVRPDHTVHLQKIDIGRDFGDHLEVLSGVKEGDLVISSPGDSAREGVVVEPVIRNQQDPKNTRK